MDTGRRVALAAALAAIIAVPLALLANMLNTGDTYTHYIVVGIAVAAAMVIASRKTRGE